MESRPNIIVIMADQLKATALGLYGNRACPTPGLERLAAEGVAFETAITPHPLCVPARVAFWTRQYPHQTGCRRNETLMPDGADHAMRRWRQVGYHCGVIGKNHCFQAGDRDKLFDTWLELGHRGLVGDGYRRGTWVAETAPLAAMHDEAARVLIGPYRHLSCYTPDIAPEAHTTGLIGARVEAFIRSRSRGAAAAATGSPFALWVSFPAPHEPYIAPKSYYDRIDPEAIELPPFDPAELEGLPRRTRFLHRMLGSEGRRDDLLATVRCYLANCLFIDEVVGRILDAVEAAGMRERTIVIFCSDHGDFAGEHDMTIKGGCFYDCLTRVPLIVAWLGTIPTGVREPSPVSLVDVVPTISHLSGIEGPESTGGAMLPCLR